MPEWGSLGSVRGALSNQRPYRSHTPSKVDELSGREDHSVWRVW